MTGVTSDLPLRKRELSVASGGDDHCGGTWMNPIECGEGWDWQPKGRLWGARRKRNRPDPLPNQPRLRPPHRLDR